MRRACLAVLLIVVGRTGVAQEQRTWSWTGDGSAFFGYNDQQRKFTDFAAWESQNWFMLTGDRPLDTGRLTLVAMVSLEPFTLENIGSPQVFQTGESYKGAPLVDRQHPHDLLMGLGATYRVERRAFAYSLAADLVGSPALGPAAFMHRDSGRDNPQAPLTHHYMDSTHITPGVVTAGIESRGISLEGSWFRGEEPDDNRLDIDRPRLDSWSVRGRWRHGPWDAQVSGGHLHTPEWFEPFDVPRLTASVAYDGSWRSHPLAVMLAWGENREIHGILDGYLLEWEAHPTENGTLYGRAEEVAKDLLDLGGPDPAGVIEFHRISHVAALTVGYIREVTRAKWGRVGIGADATLYRVPANLTDPYGSPHSFHVFLRWRPNDTAPGHVH